MLFTHLLGLLGGKEKGSIPETASPVSATLQPVSTAGSVKLHRKLLVPNAMLSALRRVLTAAATLGVARSGSNNGLIGNELLLAAINSEHSILSQHAVNVLHGSMKSLTLLKPQKTPSDAIEDDNKSVLVCLCGKLKIRLLTFVESARFDLSSDLTATYVLRSVCTLVRLKCSFSHMELRNAILDLLVVVTRLLSVSRSLLIDYYLAVFCVIFLFAA